MKYSISAIFAILVVILFVEQSLQAQTIIGGSDRDPSALLELRSNDKGLLLPRLSSEQRAAIPAPAKGLVLFNTTLNCVEINIGTPTAPNWLCLAAPSGLAVINSLNCVDATHNGMLTAGAPAANVFTLVSYTGGNGGNYSAQSVSSTGVTGLTATLAAGMLINGDSTLI